jgi:hypothetical protein
MNIEPLMQNREQALALWKKYQTHKHGNYSAIDVEIAKIAKMVAGGKVMIAALKAIIDAGADPTGRPKLAIMRADQKLCYLDLLTDGRAIMHARKEGWNLHRAAASVKFEFPAGTFPTSTRTRRLESIVPHIPPDIRPKRGLQNYHILYEAVWRREIPVDPMLLRRVGNSGDLWIVCGAWDLTDIERAVLAGHMPKQ